MYAFGHTMPGTIAVLQLGRLGDTVLATPLFSALRTTFPGAEIIALTGSDNGVILQGHPSVDRVIALPRAFLALPATARRLRSAMVDLYIDFKDHRSTTSRRIAGMIEADVRLLYAENAPSHRPWTPIRASTISEPHYVDVALAPMSLIAPGVSFERRPSLPLPIESVRRVDPQMVPGDQGIIAVNISAGDRSRNWGLGKWEDLIDALSHRYSVAVLSSPEDRPKADEVCAMRRQARPIRTENLLDVAIALTRSRVVISPDTSVIHVASALDVPVVGLYPSGERNLARFAPLSKQRLVLLPPGDELLASIDVADVIAAVEALVG